MYKNIFAITYIGNLLHKLTVNKSFTVTKRYFSFLEENYFTMLQQLKSLIAKNYLY
jgi:hypothetical protein